MQLLASPCGDVELKQHHRVRVARATEEGRSSASLARHLGVRQHQLQAWMEDDVDFRLSVIDAQSRAQVWWEDRLRDQALDGNAASTKFAMTNFFPNQFRDRREVGIEQTETFEIEYIDMVGYTEEDDDSDD